MNKAQELIEEIDESANLKDLRAAESFLKKALKSYKAYNKSPKVMVGGNRFFPQDETELLNSVGLLISNLQDI